MILTADYNSIQSPETKVGIEERFKPVLKSVNPFVGVLYEGSEVAFAQGDVL